MHNKTLCPLSKLPMDGHDLLIADEDCPATELKDRRLSRSLFVRVGLKNTRFNNCSLHYCIFDQCYLRRARFDNVDFTGSLFKDCNLRRASFGACKLRYTKFVRCDLDYDEILSLIPAEPSIAIPLLRSLRQNALDTGEVKAAHVILVRQIDAEKRELKARFWATSTYYRERYDIVQRAKSGLDFTGLVVSGWIWGHGLKMAVLLRSGLLIILAFTVALWRCGQFRHEGTVAALRFWEALYVSVVTFTTLGYGDYVPASRVSRVVCGTESLLGIVFLGFLAATVYRRFAR